MNKKEEITSWLSALSSLRIVDGSIIKYISYDYKKSFVELHKESRYVALTDCSGTVKTITLDKSSLAIKDDDFNDHAYYFYTITMNNKLQGVISVEKTISRVVNKFIYDFGYMNMELHVIERRFKSSGDIDVSVLVSDAEFKNF